MRSKCRFLIWLAPIVCVAVGCSIDDGRGGFANLDNPSTPIETAQAIVPFGAPQTELVAFPDEMLLAFLECTENAIGTEVVVLPAGETVSDPAAIQQQLDQEFAASDCALENGLDEFAPIWTPTPQSEIAEAFDRWLAAANLCMNEVGISDPPMRDFGGGFDEPDFALVISQDPSLDDPLRACMREQGEDFPGDE